MKVSLANTVVLKGDYFSSSITWFLIDGEFDFNIIWVIILRPFSLPFSQLRLLSHTEWFCFLVLKQALNLSGIKLEHL